MHWRLSKHCQREIFNTGGIEVTVSFVTFSYAEVVVKGYTTMRTNGARDYSNVRNGGTSSLVSGIELKWDIIFIQWKWILLIGI